MPVEQIEEIWKKPATGIVLCSVTVICVAYLQWRLPLPGVAVAVLGAVAAIMSLRPDMKVVEKAVWMLIVSALLLAEIRAIRKDRNDAAAQALSDRNTQEQGFKSARDQQNTDFNQTAVGLQTAIDGLQMNLKIAEGTFQQTLPHSTLRNSYFELENIPNPPDFSKSAVDYKFKFPYVNDGNISGRLLRRSDSIYTGKPDDLQTENELAAKFEEDWKKIDRSPKAAIVPPNVPLYWDDPHKFSDSEIQSLLHGNTIYVMRRLEYLDSTGVWWSDRCDYFQVANNQFYTRVFHPCTAMMDDRYRPRRR